MATKLKSLRWDGSCAACSAPTPAREKAWHDSVAKHVICTRCRPIDFVPAEDTTLAAPAQLPPPQPINVGVAGLSAEQEYAKRRDRHQQRAGGVATLETATPQHVLSWEKGADGERRLGWFLDASLSGQAVVLHDRKVPGSRANIDHIVISANGVWVIDAKNWTGLVEVRRGSRSKGTDTELYVNRRRRTEAVEKMGWQCDTVRALTEPLGLSVPIFPMLCFTDSDWPRVRVAEELNGVTIAWPEKAVELTANPGRGDAATINAVATQISSGLPATAAV